MSAELLRRAADLLRRSATAALRDPDEQWMTDQSPDDGLIVGSFVPEDVDEGGVSTSCIAYFAYPDDAERRTYDGAVAVASYIALMHPPVALALAEWLDSAARDAEEIGTDHRAVATARAVLREAS